MDFNNIIFWSAISALLIILTDFVLRRTKSFLVAYRCVAGLISFVSVVIWLAIAAVSKYAAIRGRTPTIDALQAVLIACAYFLVGGTESINFFRMLGRRADKKLGRGS